MKSVVAVKDAVMSLTRLPDFHDLQPSPHEWEIITGGVEILDMFVNVTKKWSADKSPTAHLVIPGLFDWMVHHNSYLKDRRSLGKGRMFASALLKSLQIRFPSCWANKLVYAAANLLDLRYQEIQLKNLDKFVKTKEFDIEQAQDHLEQEHLSSSVATEPSGEGGSTASEQLLGKRNDCQTKVTLSISLPLLNPTADGVSVLKWWKECEEQLPSSAKLVRKLYAVPASSTSGRTFSASGACISTRCTSLAMENVSMLFF